MLGVTLRDDGRCRGRANPFCNGGIVSRGQFAAIPRSKDMEPDWVGRKSAV